MRYPAAFCLLLMFLMFPVFADPQIPSSGIPPTPPAPVERQPGTGWAGKARDVVEEATERHVRVLEKLGTRLPDHTRPEIDRVRDEAAMARESAARAFRSPSQNEMEKARGEVRESFRQSRTSLSRMSAGMTGREAKAVQEALHRIATQQDRALRGFDALLGSEQVVPASRKVPNPNHW
jgi:uncharacterized membrane protein YccC